MAENMYVLNTGVNIPTDFTATPTGSFNVTTSTNPRIVTEDSNDSTTSGFYCYEIHSEASTALAGGSVGSSLLNRLFPVSTTVADYATNLFENPGYRMTIDTGSSGVTLADGKDYFVIIYADDMYKHHIAKITEKHEYEGTKFNFDFEPALKENMAMGTKVAIFQGPDNIKASAGADNVVALGYGLLNDIATSEERHDKYVEVSRPTFYFYEGTALEHDRKYTAIRKSTNDSSTAALKTVFVTDSPTSGYILDKSFFTQNGTLVDNNKLNDRLLNGSNVATPRGINTHNAQGSTYTFDHTTWTSSSKNYDDSDGGLKTYISYIDSPSRNQIISTPYNLTTNKTVTNKGNMFHAKYYDTERMLNRKVNDNERVKVKELVGSKDITTEANAKLPGFYARNTASSIIVTGLQSGQDLKRLLGSNEPYEPILVNGFYYVITNITNKVSGSSTVTDGTQFLTISHRRALSSNAYEAIATNGVENNTGMTAFRKVWSEKVSNFLVGHEIDTQLNITGLGGSSRNGKALTISGGTVYQPTVYSEESDIYNLEYVIDGKYYGYTMNVLAGDSVDGYTVIDFEPVSSYYYQNHILNSLTGKLLVYKTIFEGRIESKETKVESGQFKFEISGRDVVADLLNTAVNTNYTYSDEYVYSTFNPYNIIYTDIGRNVSSISDKVIVCDDVPNVKAGETLYLKGTHSTLSPSYYLLGIVKSVSGNNITLMKDSYITNITFDAETTLATDIYKSTRTVVAGKTLETSLRNTNRATTLIGTADKGAVFTTGKYFDFGTAYTDIGELSSITSRTINGCSYSNGTTITTPADGTNDLITGMLVRGTGIPAGATIVSITNTTSFVLSATTTGGSLTSQSLIFGNLNGFDINNLLTTISSATDYTDSPIGFDFNYHTISSMVEFPVLSSVDTKDGITQYEIGYVSPIVAGRIETDNLLDTFIESTDTAQASRKNSNIYLINGQGMPLGGFLHLLDGMLDSDLSPKTFNNIFEDDPTLGSTVNSQYALRFNTPIWRYVNKCIGRLGRRLYTNMTSSTNAPYSYNDYYEKESNYNFYASGYKANVGRIPTADEHKDDSLLYRLELPTESSGLFPVVGARTYDITRYPDNFNTSIHHYGRRLETDNNSINITEKYKAMYELYDNYSGPLHLFSVGDIYPESKKNPNNIGFTDGNYSRNIEDYGVVFKGEPKGIETSINHTNWSGSSVIKNRLDGDYFYQTIQSSKGDLRRMNLVRLTDVTYDMMMNEVDYESYKHDNMGGLQTHSIMERQLGNSQLVKSFPESGFSPIDITLTSNISTGSTIAVNDDSWYDSAYIFNLYTDPYTDYSRDHVFNRNEYGVSLWIGKVASVSSNTITLATSMGSAHTGVGYTSGSKIYVTVKLAAETGELYSAQILGNNPNQFPIVYQTEVDNGDGELNHNYNKTMALVNVGDGNTSLSRMENGSGDEIVSANRFPLNVDTTATAGTLHDVSGIVQLPYIIGNATDGNQFNSNAPYDQSVFGFADSTSVNTVGKHLFRWNFNANFNGNVITIANGKALQFFNNNGTGAMFMKKIETFIHVNPEGTIADSTVTINNAFSLTVGSDSSYNEILLRLTAVTDTQLTFSTHRTNAVSPSWTNSDETNCTLIIYTVNQTSPAFGGAGGSTGTDDYTKTMQSVERLFPMRAIQDSKAGLGFAFKNMHPVVMDIPSYGGNTGSEKLGSGADCLVTGSIYPREPSQIKHFDIQVGGNKHDGNTYDVDGVRVILHGSTSAGDTPVDGLFEDNVGGTDFAGVRPVELLFKPFIDVSDFTVVTHATDVSLKPSEKILVTTMNTDHLKQGSTSAANEWLCYSNNLTGYYLYGSDGYNTSVKRLYKIISHTVAKKATTFKHYLKIDNAPLVPLGDLTLMKINQTCTYDYSPKVIHLNQPSYTYTKKPGSDKMTDFIASEKIVRGKPNGVGKWQEGVKTGGVMSMYSIIEPDGGSDSSIVWSCIVTNNDATVTHNAQSKIMVGSRVSGTGIPVGATVASLNSTTSFELSAVATSGQIGFRALTFEGDNYLIPREPREISFTNSFPVSSNEYSVHITDGINSFNTSLSVSSNVLVDPSTGPTINEVSNKILTFADMKETKGTPSIGSVFTINTVQNPDFKPKSISICSPFKVVREAEEIADDILSKAGLTYNKSTSEDNYYLASNFTGQNALSAINSALSYKDLKLRVSGESMQIVSDEDEKDYREIVFSETSNDYNILGIKRDRTLYDKYNKVVVFGDGVKGIAINHRDVKKLNREYVKEIYDYSIVDSKQVDEKAVKLLNLYTSLLDAVEIEVGNKIPFLEPGQIVTLSYPSEGILTNDYLVIEVNKEIGYPIKILLGQYNRDLANTFSMLLTETRNLQGRTKQKVYTSVTSPNVDIQGVRVKLVRAQIINTASGTSTASVLGFTKTLGFTSGLGL